jgi:hypothetical protein
VICDRFHPSDGFIRRQDDGGAHSNLTLPVLSKYSIRRAAEATAVANLFRWSE